jgi:hypothetical protein
LICHGLGGDRAGGKLAGCSCRQAAGTCSSSERHSCPSPAPSENPGDSCQCICGGAVIDDAGVHELKIETNWSLLAAVVEPVLVQADVLRVLRLATPPWPDDGVNVGRALCCLYSTLLC